MSNVPRTIRGKGVKPLLVYRALRITPDVVEYYEKNFTNASKKMREVLTAYKEFKENTAWAEPLDRSDNQELEYNNGDNTRKESEGQSSQDSEGV
jgi:hypothetical protein